MKVVAIIPVKAKSVRVASKNFKEFIDGKSLFDILFDKLLACDMIDAIYVSSDERSIGKFVTQKGCKFLLRDEEYCNNDTSWSDVISHVVDSVPESDDTTVMWCHTTSPLFDRYDEAVKQYRSLIESGDANGLVTVSRLSEFIVTEKKMPLNYAWGVWHPYSQNLEKLYAVTGALFIANKKEMINNKYVISSNPYLFETTAFEAIDIDTHFDFELAKLMYQNKATFDEIC